MSHETLAGILKSRGASISNGAIEAALRDPEVGTGLAEWAKVHLTDDTLLTVDELDLYASLQRSGRADELAASLEANASTPLLPLSEGDLRAAITALHHSTETITKQTTLLHKQQEAVARLVRTKDQTRDSRAALLAARRPHRDAARQALAADVDALARSMDGRILDLEQSQGKSVQHTVQATVDDLCRSDDKLLASLQKLGWALTVADDEDEQKSLAQLRDVCVRLIKHTVETIRTKLDRLYLEALEGGPSSGGAETADGNDDADVLALQEELESLYSEILPVAQMSVEHQYLEPALKSLSGKHGQSMARSLLALDYINDCLDFLLEHITLLSARIETAQAHRAATETLVSTARTELSAPVSVSLKKERPKTVGSPVRRRRVSAGRGASVSPVRTRAGGRRRSSGVGTLADGEPPMEQLLQSLSIVLPVREDDDGTDTGATNIGLDASHAGPPGLINARFLQATLLDRSTKADGVARSVQESFEEALTDQLTDARRAVWMARESVLAESPYGTVELVDPEIDASIAVMAQEVGRIEARLADVSKEVNKARGKNIKRDQFVARWG